MIQYILDLAFCSKISAFFDRPAIQAECKGVTFLFVTSLGEAPLAKKEKRTRISMSEDIHSQGWNLCILTSSAEAPRELFPDRLQQNEWVFYRICLQWYNQVLQTVASPSTWH